MIMFEFLYFPSEIKLIISIIAVGISSFSVFYYIHSIFKKNVKPHYFTWLIKSIILSIAAYSQFKGGGGYGALFTLWAAMGASLITVISYFKGITDIKRSDKSILALCLFSIILIPLLKTPFISLIVLTITDTSGFYPTLRKSFHNPYSDNTVSLFLFGVTNALGILALQNYNFLTLFYPIAMIFSYWFTVSFLLVRRVQLRTKI